MLIPHLDTQAWIKALNYSIIEDWRPWLISDQVAGYISYFYSYLCNSWYIYIFNLIRILFLDRYTRYYANNMTFATIKVSKKKQRDVD